MIEEMVSELVRASAHLSNATYSDEIQRAGKDLEKKEAQLIAAVRKLEEQRDRYAAMALEEMERTEIYSESAWDAAQNRIEELEEVCRLALETVDDDAPGRGLTERELIHRLRDVLHK